MSLEAFKATTIHLGERTYPVFVGYGLLGRLGEVIDEYLDGVTGCVVVTSPSVDALYGGEAMAALESLHPAKVIVPEGEDAKTWESAGNLLGALIEHGLNRRGVVVALGGGSVGDSAGFAASIYMRGIRLIQVPTTLLGQVDSGIGGKTAVNHSYGKNLIGSFHQPSLVACDTAMLSTLPARELRSGLAEVAKYGVIADASLFKHLEDGSKKLDLDLRWVVSRCAAAKAHYIEADERDTRGIRSALNYGHTFGHAVETLSRHSIRHGEAISIGMSIASRVTVSLGVLRRADLERQIALLAALGLPTEAPCAIEDLLPLTRRDKKADGILTRLVLPTGIGSEPVVRSTSEEEIVAALEG